MISILNKISEILLKRFSIELEQVAFKGYASKALREQIEETSNKLNISKNPIHDRTMITCIGTYIKSEN
ncbi:transposase (fragment) [Acinetobacter sp. 8I-beige]